MNYQKIFFGAPGTGKSYKIKQELKTLNIPENRIFRVTFHPEYSYSDFIGQILPKIEIDTQSNEKSITYEFSKGIFTQALEKAFKDLTLDVYLIIEEMSRGNVASIFGDVFQLLDRENIGTQKGFSKYPISNDFISKDIVYFPDNKVQLPPNLIIYGSVNTSDQNVFTMDTAFKRRFNWEYISVDPIKEINNPTLQLYHESQMWDIPWNRLYMGLNKFISSRDFLDLGEDKQLGQFFIDFSDMTPQEIDDVIKNKLLHYLWNDIHKISFRKNVHLFQENIQSYGELYNRFENKSPIFSKLFIEQLNLS